MRGIFTYHINSNKIDYFTDSFKFINIDRGLGSTVGNILEYSLLYQLEGICLIKLQFIKLVGYIQNYLPSLLLNFQSLQIKHCGSYIKVILLKIFIIKSGNLYSQCLRIPFNLILLNNRLLCVSWKKQNSAYCLLQLGKKYTRQQQLQGYNSFSFDRLFSPVLFCTHKIRISKNLGKEILILTIQTNGSITPYEAIQKISCLVKQNLQFV